MSLYRRFVLPRLTHLAMKSKVLREERAKVVSGAHGQVLEIGIGSGLNLPYYSETVQRVIGVDSSAELLAMARRNAARAALPVELVCESAERLPFADASFDSAVMTWTLCSIPDPAAALREIRRVLKVGGKLFFVEHGLSREPRVGAWQQRLTPLWRPLAGGCHLDRRIDALIRAVFTHVELETFYVEGPRLLTYLYEGRAHA
ncbi:MAG TPA: class I SAM-dependent methyltransferase [Burkholderiales bacterium]|nr:class I SAM-dependent methyltransferase [Burkholderiales bacterium]